MKQTLVEPMPSYVRDAPRREADSTAPSARAGTRPEVRLLLACTRSSVDERTAESIRDALEGALDWEFVLRKAQQNYIVPLVCENLTKVCPELLPDEVLRLFRSRLRTHAANNLFATRELVRLVRLLDEEGIPALPFKGPLLAARAYGNLSLRQFGDLDVLVRERDVARAIGVLRAHGYELHSPVAAPGGRQKDMALVSADGRTRLELHWRLSRVYFSFSLDSRRNAKRMWQRLETVEVGGYEVRTLPVVDLLLYLCSHGAKHRWERLQWIGDVAELVRASPHLDWGLVFREARSLGCDRVLALGLRLAHDLLDAPLPEDVARRIAADEHVRPAFELTCEQLFDEPHRFSHSLEKHHYRHVLKERWRDRVRLGLTYSRVYLRLAFRPSAKDREMLPVPQYLSFLHYLARPVRLGIVYSSVLLKAMSKNKR